MLNRILKFSIEHRFIVISLALAAAVLGFYSLTRLPIDAVPDISSRLVQISTVCPSLTPSEIEKRIAFPVETAMAGIPRLTGTRSLSRNGFCQVEAIFEDDADIFFCRQQVAERLEEIRDILPAGAEPRLGPITTGLGEVYFYLLDMETRPAQAAPDGQAGWQADGGYLTPEGEILRTEGEKLSFLRTLQDWLIKPQLQTVPDVAGVDTIGGYQRQFVIEPDPVRLVAYQLSMKDLTDAVARNNNAIGAGFIEQNGEALIVRSDARVQSCSDIESISVTTRNGVPIWIRDLATVSIGRELRTGAASENGRELVVGTVLMRLGANSRAVARAVDEKIGGIRHSLPPGIRLRTGLDRTTLVDATIRTVRNNLLEGALLVILILFLLLGNIRAAIITALAIPFSFLITALGMEKFGISGNLMSLGALDFGLVVDGSVIIVENCLRHLMIRRQSLGRDLSFSERIETVFTASREVRGATAFGELIIMVVYIPILALTGVEGKMFHPMALTVILALGAALVLTLTFIPAATAIFLGKRLPARENRVMEKARHLYRPVLIHALRHRWIVIGAGLAAFLAATLLFFRLGHEFVPKLDEGNISLQSLRIPTTSLNQSVAMQLQVEKAVAALPEVACMFSKTGTAEVAFDPMPPNISDAYIILKPAAAWPDPALPKAELIKKIQQAAASVPGNLYEVSQPIELRVNELIAGSRGDLAVKVFGDDFSRIAETARQVLQVIQATPGAADVKMNATEGYPTLNFRIRREEAARLGLDMDSLQDLIETAINGREAGFVFEGDRRSPVVIRLAEDHRRDLDRLSKLPVLLTALPAAIPGLSSSHGLPNQTDASHWSIPLNTVVDIINETGPSQINRENGKRRLTVQANVRERDLGSFVEEVHERTGRMQLQPGTWLEWGGQYQNLLSARNRLAVVVPFCFFLIFLFLFASFNSARQALLVFTGVPLALTGGVLSLWLRDIPFSISAGVGFIALSGVAVLNGLVMVSTINQLRRETANLDEAIIQGSLTRLRPVLTTALVASLGFLPMALATGTGAEVQRPLATVVIGGILSSTLLTLLVLPALYRVWNSHPVARPLAMANGEEN